MSLPGQTIGVSAFNEPLMEAVHLTRSQLALAYMIGTVASAVFLTPAGNLYDKYGARIMAIASSAVLGAVLVFLSYTGKITDYYQLNALQAIAMTAFGFFVLRFSGQGVLTMTCRNMSMKCDLILLHLLSIINQLPHYSSGLRKYVTLKYSHGLVMLKYT